MQVEGIPYRLEVPVWHRGPARVVPGPNPAVRFLVLDRARALPYAAVGSAEMVFDLERVTDETSAAQFVGKYGLPAMETRDFIGDAWVYPLDHFLHLANSVRTCLRVYRWLRPAIEGDPEAIAELRSLEREALDVTGRAGVGVQLEPRAEALITDLRARATRRPRSRANDAELIALMAQSLTFLVNMGLVGVEERVSAAIAWPAPSREAQLPRDAFTMSVQPRTLTGAIFHQLAAVILNRRPLTQCDRCGSLYFQEDPRQRFCTQLCADRTRRERYRQRHAKGGRSGKKRKR